MVDGSEKRNRQLALNFRIGALGFIKGAGLNSDYYSMPLG